ncbi:hypothetical protein BCR41DRAFT_372088 [Lobosporangium transversale]|uniref:Uncharacterized protein n=1 Tax=Lobosporangium transversale TaxID=64571 RepID=A0A1Y2GMQ4_9FUNG|nr:hypothetical protein BCR41DRAFT_372233 [Lobosporangium transversale]XP_021879873.1 hypothetical protein BCR41DRAFT_372088 [Lobosporangium transversale]ORZ10918.1 hypothetical protein BCR41DRAFT_372233 [Lobosporangium transversale]ORZ11776.1 hypothetical protein BCR41DRAFT_372088 [Lobosporangium transversale]|eukprot:XP_021879435.1 hypothetical protein BCR41DRAFT_372233 [Lobosporangium transversale]
MQNKARKRTLKHTFSYLTQPVSLHMSESITSVLNDSSLVLYRVNEHIHKKVPQLVEEKRALASTCKSVETANQDLEDARQIISSMQWLTELSEIEALVKRALS